ncbi:MAG TPA: hypothetical protein VGQ83_29785 [Polyangia bacterium]|jgi:hypothetical protein
MRVTARAALGGILAMCLVGCDSGGSTTPAKVCDTRLPDALPFAVTRPAVGDPVSAADVTAFTRKVTGLWKQVGYFQWIGDTSHGVDAATGLPDWSVWWTGVEVVKAGGAITFHHSESGGPDNIFIPTSRVLSQLSAGYLLTGDPAMGRVVAQYAKGLTASMQGMVWDASDPVRSIMARAVIPNNHTVTLGDGRVKAIDYTAWRQHTEAWNSHTIHVAQNPYWGDIWVKNMRSKDDVPHIFHAAVWLPWVAAQAPDETVRAAAAEAWQYVQGFTKDIVDSGYVIRSKNEDGQIFVPTEDLASFVQYEALIPNAECNAKLNAALIGYGALQGNDCLDGHGGAYETIAVTNHYYNMAIVRNFHLSAILHSLRTCEDAAAEALMAGLITRIDADLARPATELPGDIQVPAWERDLAVYLVQSSAAGLPLTAREVRLVHQYYGQAVDELAAWDKWNPWDPAVADGTFDYRPRGVVDAEDMAFFLEACWSPFRATGGEAVVDCDVVRDPARWGE